jgi:hypothetical protein
MNKLYYSLIAQVGEERAALGNYLTLIFALVYGVVLLGERITIPAVVGLALIIGGAEITLRGDGTKHAGGKAKPTNTGRVLHSTRSHTLATCSSVSPPSAACGDVALASIMRWIKPYSKLGDPYPAANARITIKIPAPINETATMRRSTRTGTACATLVPIATPAAATKPSVVPRKKST